MLLQPMTLSKTREQQFDYHDATIKMKGEEGGRDRHKDTEAHQQFAVSRVSETI